MNLRQSISHPELLIGSDGTIYRASSGEKLNIIRDHGTTMRGFIVAYRHEGKIKQLSVLRLVYEAHVKKKPIESYDFIECLDGNDFNPSANNLTSGSKYKKPVKEVKKTQQYESYSCWMNGNDEVYI